MSGAVQEREAPGQTRGMPEMSDDEVHGLASRLGWKPKEEYLSRGYDETKWVDARQFVETADRNPAVMWNNLQTLDKRHARLEREAADTKRKLDEAVGMLGDMGEQFRSVREQSYQRARRELQGQRSAAVEAGDKDAFQRLDAELSDLEKDKPPPRKTSSTSTAPPPTQTNGSAPPPEVIAWGAKNPWFYADTDLQAEANALHVSLMTTRPHLSLSENLELVERNIKALHPDKFRTAPRSKPTPQANPDNDDDDPAPAGERPNGPVGGGRRSNKRDFASLPREARTAFTRYAKMIGAKEGAKPLTEAEWAENYYSQFPEEP